MYVKRIGVSLNVIKTETQEIEREREEKKELSRFWSRETTSDLWSVFNFICRNQCSSILFSLFSIYSPLLHVSMPLFPSAPFPILKSVRSRAWPRSIRDISRTIQRVHSFPRRRIIRVPVAWRLTVTGLACTRCPIRKDARFVLVYAQRVYHIYTYIFISAGLIRDPSLIWDLYALFSLSLFCCRCLLISSSYFDTTLSACLLLTCLLACLPICLLSCLLACLLICLLAYLLACLSVRPYTEVNPEESECVSIHQCAPVLVHIG